LGSSPFVSHEVLEAGQKERTEPAFGRVRRSDVFTRHETSKESLGNVLRVSFF
jgi:hypothetical protein